MIIFILYLNGLKGKLVLGYFYQTSLNRVVLYSKFIDPLYLLEYCPLKDDILRVLQSHKNLNITGTKICILLIHQYINLNIIAWLYYYDE